ncbi:MAG: dihydroorotate dehydrogenase electron transfer subunit [Ruminococcus sp.]|nr:dihydroorotate dehydrogenase electron transfer subunit [Ruminococcus sp.]
MNRKILNKQNLNETVFDFEIEWNSGDDLDKKPKPGQFVHILPDGKTLRRPISIAEIKSQSIRIIFEVRGEGTKLISQASDFDVIGPLGNGFTLGDYKKVLIVGGGIGVPPLLELFKHYPKADVVLGFRSSEQVILADEFNRISDKVDIQVGNIVNLPSENYDMVFTVGPTAMMKAVAEKYSFCQVSLEERMGCGVGACLGCSVRTDTGMKTVCKDGPVFFGNEILF